MPIQALDLNLLVALDRLLATSSVTLAAGELGITQPAMSRSLQRLRDVLGDPLLVRVGRGLVPTPRAEALVPVVSEALQAARRVFTRPEPFDPATARGEVRIAMGDESQATLGPAILESLWRQAPNVDVRLLRLSLETVPLALSGKVDLALSPDLAALPLSAGPAPDLREFVVRKLYERRFVVVSSPRHPRRRFTLESFTAADHLLVGPDGSGRGFVDELLAARGLHRRVAVTVSNFASATHMVAQSRLVATLPEEAVRMASVRLVVARPPLELPTLPVMLVWHPRNTTDPRHRFVRESVVRAIRAARKEGPTAALA